MLKLKDIYKKYEIKNNDNVIALDGITCTFEKGKFYVIVGCSGSGKSTLINILGLVDTFDDGKYMIDNVDTQNLNEDEKANIRMKKFGFVFQKFFLNERLTACDNVIVPMLINKNIEVNKRKILAQDLLKSLGLENRINHKPNELSGGEQQRVAIARALVNDPDFIIADEPTGNLDKTNEKMVRDILKDLTVKNNKGVIVVTHSDEVKKYADVIYKITDGKLVGDDLDEN